MVRLNNEMWRNIFRNISELDEEDRYDDAEWVEVLWLDPGDSSGGEWVLCYGEELFEDGFTSEEEAYERLHKLENELIEEETK